MKFALETACGTATGKVRKNNEDNFLFHGKCLPEDNTGMKKAVEGWVDDDFPACFAVFDGMGGESCGETASYIAARTLNERARQLREYIIPEKTFLKSACSAMSDAVFAAQQTMSVGIMGTTAVIALFQPDELYICNIGDSRAYRLRQGVFQQLTRDDCPAPVPGMEAQHRSNVITQYLGADPQELCLAPHVAKGAIQEEDWYLLCSDGLTDMLSTFEMADIMLTSATAKDCVNNLIHSALEKGGKDNATAIVCHVVPRD